MSINTQSEFRILVTGGAGFIGGCLIRRLLKVTKAKIFNLDKFGYASNLTSIENCIGSERHYFLNIDLFDAKDTSKALAIANPDLIMHLAAESHVDRSIDDPSSFLKSNVIGTFNLLEAVRNHWERMEGKRKNRFRFLHVSTDEVFGSLDPRDQKFTEESIYDPRSPYSATKASSDHLVNAWHHSYEIPTIVTNCSNNYGPWQFPEKLIPLVISKAINKELIPLYGDGENIRDWLYVEDHIDALLLAIQKGKIGEKYCIGGNSEKSNKDIVLSICRILDKRLPLKTKYESLITYVEDRPGHDKRYAIDSSLISNQLGWRPKTEFDQGLFSTVDWYIKNQDWCDEVKKNSGYLCRRLGMKK